MFPGSPSAYRRGQPAHHDARDLEFVELDEGGHAVGAEGVGHRSGLGGEGADVAAIGGHDIDRPRFPASSPRRWTQMRPSQVVDVASRMVSFGVNTRFGKLVSGPNATGHPGRTRNPRGTSSTNRESGLAKSRLRGVYGSSRSGADYLLGVQRDELDVPFVVMIMLERDE